MCVHVRACVCVETYNGVYICVHDYFYKYRTEVSLLGLVSISVNT